MTHPDACAAHDWTATTTHADPAPTFACTSCGTTTTGCRDCARPLDGTALPICERCLERARGLLDDIGTFLAAMTDVARVAVGLRAVRYDLTGTPSTANAARLPHGLDAAYREDNVLVSGPATIRTHGGAMDLLESWVDDWAERCGDDEGAWDTLAYLRSKTLWAALNHPAWHDYLSELRATRAVVRRLAGLAPEREPAPCVHCGGTVVRDWTTWEGLSDVARCTGCGTTWGSHAHLALTERWHVRALPAERPDALVTAEQARAIWPHLKRNTLNQWISRHLLEPVDRDEHGRPRFILAAVAARVAGSAA